MGRSAFAFGALAVLLASGLVSCGGGSGDPVAAAVAKSGRSGAASVSFELTYTDERTGPIVTFQGQGVTHGPNDNLTFDFSTGMPSVLQPAGVGESSVREIKVRRRGDEILYLRVPGVPGGRHWVELDLTKTYRATGLHLGSLTDRPETQDPSQLLAMLSGEVGKVRNLGPSSTPTGTATRYQVTIDLAKALQATEPNGGPPLFIAAGAGRQTVTEDVSVGGDGLIRELTATYSMKIRGIPIQLKMELDFIRYGIRTHVIPPARADTLDLTPLLARHVGLRVLTSHVRRPVGARFASLVK